MQTSNLDATGQCANCGASNAYVNRFCGSCGQRLAWADALEAAEKQNQQVQFEKPSSPVIPVVEQIPSQKPRNIQPRPAPPKSDKFSLLVAAAIVAVIAFPVCAILSSSNFTTLAPVLFFLLLISSLVGWVIGFISPKVFSPFFKGQPTRKKIGTTFGLTVLGSFTMFAATVPPIKEEGPVRTATATAKARPTVAKPTPTTQYAPGNEPWTKEQIAKFNKEAEAASQYSEQQREKEQRKKSKSTSEESVSSSKSGICFGSLCVRDLKAKSGEFMNHVTGIVVNTGEEDYGYVQVEINLYDETDNQVGSTLANVTNLEARGRWKFEAPVLEDNAKYFKVKDVIGR